MMIHVVASEKITSFFFFDIFFPFLLIFYLIFLRLSNILGYVCVIRNLYNVFHSGNTHLYSHQKYTKTFFFSLHLWEHLLSFVFLIIAIFTSVKWFLILVLIYIFTTISGVEPQKMSIEIFAHF